MSKTICDETTPREFVARPIAPHASHHRRRCRVALYFYSVYYIYIYIYILHIFIFILFIYMILILCILIIISIKYVNNESFNPILIYILLN